MNEEEEEIFMRPIQKQEVIKLLKQYHLLEEKNLKPLELLADTDFIDIDLAAFYWNLLVNKNGVSSSKKSESSINKIEESFINISDYDLDILDSSDTLEKIQWSEIMEPKNDDKFEEFENTLMQLDDSLVATSWEKASLKIFEEYAKIVLSDKEIREEITKEELNELRENFITENDDNEETGRLNYILVENKDQENKMNKVLDLDKRIKDLMEELGDERKKKKTCEDRTSLNVNSVLNDTLEEMEVLMKCGESYMTRESITNQSEIKNSAFIRSKSEDSIFEKTKVTPIPKNAKQSPKTPQPKRKIRKQKSTTPSTSSSSSKYFSNVSEFKIPISRAPRRLIHSPIGDYIKNSPTIPLIKKVVSTPITGSVKLLENYREVLQENSNNTPIKLPTKTYKPAARNLFVEKENEAKIPKNIQKLYTTPVPQIIKHIGRVPSNKLPSFISKSDFENNADLTVLEESKISTEENLENVNNDETKTEVSLYVSKQPLHSNSLQTNCK